MIALRILTGLGRIGAMGFSFLELFLLVGIRTNQLAMVLHRLVPVAAGCEYVEFDLRLGASSRCLGKLKSTVTAPSANTSKSTRIF